MSRIGKKLIELPAGVTLTVGTGNVVTVKGPKGQLTQDIDRDISVEINGNIVELKRPTDQIRHRALHGLSRALVNNLVVGVTAGFKKELELVGVGYKASSQSNILDLSLGYSHNIIFEIPRELSVRTTQEKEDNPRIF